MASKYSVNFNSCFELLVNVSRDIVRCVICCNVCISVLRFTFAVLCGLTEMNKPAQALDVCSWRCQTDMTSKLAVCQRDELLYI